MRICIAATQVPFTSGGAELHVETLRAELVRRGFDVDVVSVPFSWEPHRQVLRSALAWRLLQLQDDPAHPIDLVIATKFPSYLIRHPNKVLWLIHQFRQVYELLGTPYSDYGHSAEDQAIVGMVREMDRRALGECRQRFTNAGNTAARMKRFNGLEAQPLYPPPPLEGRYRAGAMGDYLFTAGRFEPLKRHELLVRTLAHTRTPVRACIAGDGPGREALERLASEVGVRDRIEFVGRVDDARLLELYAGALGVFYAPFDEDYGYVTVEGFKSSRPVLTARDSGGPLEFVRDGENGFIRDAGDLRGFAACADRLYDDREYAKRLGEAGGRRVAGLTWDHVIESLTGRRVAAAPA